MVLVGLEFAISNFLVGCSSEQRCILTTSLGKGSVDMLLHMYIRLSNSTLLPLTVLGVVTALFYWGCEVFSVEGS